MSSVGPWGWIISPPVDVEDFTLLWGLLSNSRYLTAFRTEEQEENAFLETFYFEVRMITIPKQKIVEYDAVTDTECATKSLKTKQKSSGFLLSIEEH